MSSHHESAPGIDPLTATGSEQAQPYNDITFAQLGVLDTWRTYQGVLTFGRGQCLAILDDGCDMTHPAWQTTLPWGPKVVATWNSIDCNADPTAVPPGYHGTSVGFPSSMHQGGTRGVAYNNHVAQVRCVSIVHLTRDESGTLAAGLEWVIEHHDRLNITAVNLSPLDDQRHTTPVATAIDAPLAHLRELGVWVSAPCGNHNYTDGISWPACQPHCFGIGAVRPAWPGSGDEHVPSLDRYANVDLLVAASATSSSNAYAAASAMIAREAIDVARYPWRRHADNCADAIMAIFHESGHHVYDKATGLRFVELNLKRAVDFIFAMG